MRKILTKGPRSHRTGNDLGERLRKPLRMGQLCARTVRSAQPARPLGAGVAVAGPLTSLDDDRQHFLAGRSGGGEPMAVAESIAQPAEQQVDKGLKAGALGLISTTIIATASVAPAYSIAATLVFVVGAVGLQSPAVAVLAFVPMLLTSIGYSELNKADPDCGTTFTWATRAFGPRTGWFGGWAIVAADVLVMASLAQVAGQYGFLLFNAKGIGSNPTSGWVLLVGVLWIVVMTYICYRGIEVSANFQKILLTIEVTMLAIFSGVALIKVATGNAPAGHLTPQWSWFNPFDISSFSIFIAGILLMLFIYWGWDTAVAVNEETADRRRTPGRAAII